MGKKSKHVSLFSCDSYSGFLLVYLMRPSERQNSFETLKHFCQKSIHCLKLSQPCFFLQVTFLVFSICRFSYVSKFFTLYCKTTYIFDQHKKTTEKHPHFSQFSFFGCSVSTAVSVSEIQTQHILGHKNVGKKFKIRIRKTPAKNPWTYSPPP